MTPVAYSSVNTNGYTRDVFILDNMAYLSDGGGGFKIVKLWE
jgi:hypothetical protein